ncbi:MAG: ribosome recycling factor [Flavobacteriales bacterium]
MSDINSVLSTAEGVMNKALERLEKELSKIRASKANPSMLDSVKVDYYGNPSPVANVANINTPDGRTLTVQPWEKGMLEPICKAILDANLGFTPQNNGTTIIISIPPLTEERRKGLVKQCKAVGEDAKVSIRQARKDANDSIKALQKNGLPEDSAKDGEAKSQVLTDKFVALVDKHVADKEKEIMTV